MEEGRQGDGQVLHVDLLRHGLPHEHPHHRQGILTLTSCRDYDIVVHYCWTFYELSYFYLSVAPHNLKLFVRKCF